MVEFIIPIHTRPRLDPVGGGWYLYATGFLYISVLPFFFKCLCLSFMALPICATAHNNVQVRSS